MLIVQIQNKFLLFYPKIPDYQINNCSKMRKKTLTLNFGLKSDLIIFKTAVFNFIHLYSDYKLNLLSPIHFN